MQAYSYPLFSHKILYAVIILATTQMIRFSMTHATSPELLSSIQHLNCSSNASICNDVCNEPSGSIPYSSTFCDRTSGSCVCDCRDTLRKDCQQTPFTPCFQDCVKKNPNPDVFLYEGGDCPVSKANGTAFFQCACGCSFRDDYEETNDIL